MAKAVIQRQQMELAIRQKILSEGTEEDPVVQEV